MLLLTLGWVFTGGLPSETPGKSLHSITNGRFFNDNGHDILNENSSPVRKEIIVFKHSITMLLKNKFWL